MVTAFSQMISDLFANRDMTEGAVYKPSAPESDLIPLRVILHEKDVTTAFGENEFLSKTTMIDLRAADVPNPKKGDQILIGEQTYTVQAEPEAQSETMVWKLNVKKG